MFYNGSVGRRGYAPIVHDRLLSVFLFAPSGQISPDGCMRLDGEGLLSRFIHLQITTVPGVVVAQTACSLAVSVPW